MVEANTSVQNRYYSQKYWNERYASDLCSFEWYGNWDSVKNAVSKYMPDKNAKILHVGCGMSNLDNDLANNGYRNVLNIDFSQVLIEHKSAVNPHLQYRDDDICQLSRYEDDQFDYVIDKGTFDCLLTSSSFFTQVEAALSEIHRVLRNDGIFLFFSYGQPLTRLHFLQSKQYKWSVESQTLLCSPNSDSDKHFYCYICRKL